MNKAKHLTIFMMSLVFVMSGLFSSQINAANLTKNETAVVVKFTLPNGVWAEVRVVENGLVKVKDQKTGQMTEFSVEVLDRKTGSVRVKILQSSGGESLMKSKLLILISKHKKQLQHLLLERILKC